MKKTLTFWFEVIGEYSDLCGEEFFVEVNADEENPAQPQAISPLKTFPTKSSNATGASLWKWLK